MKKLLVLAGLLLGQSAIAQVQPETKTGSMVVGAPTGGNEGTGSVNMQSCFVNGVACAAGGGTPPSSVFVLGTSAGGAFQASTAPSGTIVGCPSGGSPCIQALTALPTGLTVPAAQVVSNPALNTFFSVTQATGGSDVYPSNSTPILTSTNGNLSYGAGNGTKVGIAELATFANAYHFGDSLTAGYYTPGYNGTSYAYWLDQTVLSPTSGRANFGLPGSVTNSNDPVIFPAPFVYSSQSLITYTIGTNNFTANGNGTTALATYLANVEAQAAWWLVPTAQKTTFQSGGVTFTGTWTNDGAGYVGKSTTGSGATATFTGTGTILYVVTLATITNASTASLSCDGVATGASLNFTGLGTQTQLTRVTGLSSGSHTCVLTAGTISGGSVGVEWVGFLTGSSVTNSPYVILGGVPPQSANANAAALTTYRTQQQTTVTTLNGDGFPNLYYVDTTTVSTSAGYYNDTVHGDGYWQYLLAQPFIAKINTIFSTPYTLNWTPQPIVDYLSIGSQSIGIGSSTSTLPTLAVTGITRSTLMGITALNAGLIGTGTLTDDAAYGFGAASASTGNQITAFGSTACATGVLTGNAANACFGFQSGYFSSGARMEMFGAETGVNIASGSQTVTTDTNGLLAGYAASKSTASILTDWAAIGDSALCDASHKMCFGSTTITQNLFHGGLTEASNGRAVNTGTTSDTVAANIASTYESLNTGSGAFTLTFAAPSGDGERRRVCFHNLTGTITYTPTTPATAIVGPATIAANTCQEWIYNSVSGTPTNAPATTWLPY